MAGSKLQLHLQALRVQLVPCSAWIGLPATYVEKGDVVELCSASGKQRKVCFVLLVHSQGCSSSAAQRGCCDASQALGCMQFLQEHRVVKPNTNLL
jgi:hypothetical protein